MNRNEIVCLAVIGKSHVDHIEQDGKIYICVEDIMLTVNNYRSKLIRGGLFNIAGLRPPGIIDLLQFLINQFRLFNKLKKPD